MFMRVPRPATFVPIALAAALSPAFGEDDVPLSDAAINAADITDVLDVFAKPKQRGGVPSPAIIKAQVILDRAAASPGAIDGFGGDTFRKALVAFEIMSGLEVDGIPDEKLLSLLDTSHQVIGTYVILEKDAESVSGTVPKDFAEMAQLDFLGYADLAEAVAEKFHMDIGLLRALNPGAAFEVGEKVFVADIGAPEPEAGVSVIEVDKKLWQVRAYAEDGALLAAYPASIGSEENPSPSGTRTIGAVAPMPTYTYNPAVNFQQGANTEVLSIPPGPNGPVGSMWIDLSEPHFGIHGTPEPSLIDETGSHGCVRLTNWDAWELSRMVSEGVPVKFLGEANGAPRSG
jgi:lipoprotein-anchoring transpeptidase ErfK/SrfK